MMGCWKKQCVTAEDVLQVQKVELWDVTTSDIQARVQPEPVQTADLSEHVNRRQVRQQSLGQA